MIGDLLLSRLSSYNVSDLKNANRWQKVSRAEREITHDVMLHSWSVILKRTNCLSLPSIESATIGVIGLGYVGLPLAVPFGSRQNVIGFDLNLQRINKLSCLLPKHLVDLRL